jgi:hypothetical protein
MNEYPGTKLESPPRGHEAAHAPGKSMALGSGP